MREASNKGGGDLFQDRESGVEDVVVDSWIDRARVAVGNVEKLVTKADRAPLARFDADSAAHIDQKIQACRPDNVDGDGLGGGNNALVGLKERIHSVLAAKIRCEPERRYCEPIYRMSRYKLREILSWL